jgi:SAM-dependent methyltransferase
VIDLGCGSGILCEAVSVAGFDVLGVDLSASMLALARRRVPRGQFRQESLLTAELPPCVAVCAVGECVNYLFDHGNTTQGLKRLFRRVHNALRPDGLFLFDVSGPGRAPEPRRGHAEGEDWAVLFTAEENRTGRRLTRRITTFRKEGSQYRRDAEVHELRLFPPSEVLGLLRGVGFRVRTMNGYGEQKFPPGLTGFLARRPRNAD